MTTREICKVAACLGLVTGLVTFDASGAMARQWTIYQRQVAEQARITKGEKSGDLTKKEADGLRSDMADIDAKIKKAKEKNAGKISIKDQGKIEKALNDVTLKIQKLELAKRVTAK